MEALQDTGTQAQLWMWAGIGIGLLLGGAAGGIAAWLGDARALTLGLAVFLLCMGLPAATGALRLAQVAVQVQEQTVPARGRLLGYEAESASEAQRRKRPGGRPAQRPRVAFTTPEGQRLEFLGLGGSRSGLAVGAEVPVRYVAARPQEALVADFQTLWGPAWALGAFGTFALSGAAVFLLGMAGRAAAQKATQTAVKPAPALVSEPHRRHRLARGLHLASVGLLLLAVPLPVVWMRARPMEIVAVVFAAITAGLVGLIVAQVLARRAATGGEPAQWPLIPALLALNFGYFALGAWLFTRA
jgi:hypothetical protein